MAHMKQKGVETEQATRAIDELVDSKSICCSGDVYYYLYR